MWFDANLSILFPDLPLLSRPAAGAALGFDAVELWWPFPLEVPSPAEVDGLVDAIGEAGQQLVALNLTSGDPAAGEHGLVAIPGPASRFSDNLDAALAIASRTGCRVLNALYGNPPDDVAPETLAETAVANLALAARRAALVDAIIVVEALNPIDFPRFGIHTIEAAVALADAVYAASGEVVAVLFDVYHVQRAEGDLIHRIERFADRFGHVQIADVPGRLHPGTGEIAFERVLAALDASPYRGFVGLEHRPSASDEETFGWLPPERRSSRRATLPYGVGQQPVTMNSDVRDNEQRDEVRSHE